MVIIEGKRICAKQEKKKKAVIDLLFDRRNKSPLKSGKFVSNVCIIIKEIATISKENIKQYNQGNS